MLQPFDIFASPIERNNLANFKCGFQKLSFLNMTCNIDYFAKCLILVKNRVLSSNSALHILFGKPNKFQIDVFLTFYDLCLENCDSLLTSKFLKSWQNLSKIVKAENTFVFPLAELGFNDDFTNEREAYLSK